MRRVRPVDLRPGDQIELYGGRYTVRAESFTRMNTGRARIVLSCDHGTLTWPLDQAQRFESVLLLHRPDEIEPGMAPRPGTHGTAAVPGSSSDLGAVGPLGRPAAAPGFPTNREVA